MSSRFVQYCKMRRHMHVRNLALWIFLHALSLPSHFRNWFVDFSIKKKKISKGISALPDKIHWAQKQTSKKKNTKTKPETSNVLCGSNEKEKHLNRYHWSANTSKMEEIN